MGEIKMKKLIFLYFMLLIMMFGCSSVSEHTNNVDLEDSIETTGDGEEATELPTLELQKGDEGLEVEILQEALLQIGYEVNVSGVYDDLTVWAVTDLQLQYDLIVSGIYNDQVKNLLEELIDEDNVVTTGSQLEKPQHPNQFPDIVENPYDILVLVNKEHALPNHFEPHDLVVPDVRFPFAEDDPKKQLRKEAADALEELFRAAEADGIYLFAVSGYRSYERQEAIFAANVEKHGEDHANTFSAKAGESEHQTGLVMDVTSQEVGFDLLTEFGESEAGKWLEQHAHEYGYIIRYPRGKEHITKYQYEPWHLRYVGKKAAKEIVENDLTLEEYLGVE